MQPLIMILLVGVAAAALGTGFLTNSINLTVQDLGVGETNLKSPVQSVAVDLVLSKIQVDPHLVPDAPQTHFHNFIDKCSFIANTNIGKTGEIICKLTDEHGDVIAEGKIVLTTRYVSPDVTFIPILQTAFHFSHDVQEVHDVKIVVLGPKPNPFP